MDSRRVILGCTWLLLALCITILSIASNGSSQLLNSKPAVDIRFGTQTRQEVVDAIKEYSRRHVKNNTSMQTQLVVTLFQDNTAGLSRREIASIYETEYTRYRSQRNNIWRRLAPGAGWISAALLLLGLIFRNTLVEWGTKGLNRIGEALYGLVAGSRPFRPLAIRRYRKAVIDRNRELKVPFRPSPLILKDIYVPLKVEGAGGSALIEARAAIATSRALEVVSLPLTV